MRHCHRSGATAVIAVLGLGAGAGAQTVLRAVVVARDLQEPLYVTHAPGDFERLFIVERGGEGTGRIRIMDLDSGAVLPTPFLSVPVGVSGEEGLLGAAFHADYQRNGLFYVCYTGPAPQSHWVIERFEVSADPNQADPGTAFNILRLPQIGPFHNGGWIGFEPAGDLYAAVGDNGEWLNAQVTQNNLRGKILRIDVNTDAFPADPDRNYAVPASNPFVGLRGDDEIWAYGLRNPWRCSVDRETHDLWIGDVGQAAWEEINLRPAPGAPPHTALNYGWLCYDGPVCTGLFGCGPTCLNVPDYRPPIHVYPHGQLNQCSVTGGYVYRGCAIPDLVGTYFFGDFCAGHIWSMRYTGGQVTGLTDRTNELNSGGALNFGLLTSFGEDALGEMYFCSLLGTVFKITPETMVGPDCNGNGVRDQCDIRSGFSPDANGNGIPDECDCYPNCNGSFQGTTPTLTVGDFACFQSRFVQGHTYADCNEDGQLTIADFGCFQGSFVQGCP